MRAAVSRVIGAAVIGVLGATAAFASGPEEARAAAGELDPNFGIGGVFTHPVPSNGPVAALQPDGKVILVVDNSEHGTVLRLNPDGTLDPSFDGDGSATIDSGTDRFET